MLFIGGPCTQGPGMIVAEPRKETLRSHHDLEKDACKYYKKACKVYWYEDMGVFLINYVGDLLLYGRVIV